MKIQIECVTPPAYNPNTNPRTTGGIFLIHTRLGKDIWTCVKPHADYVSQDDLDDMDIFNEVPHWEYTISAIRALINNKTANRDTTTGEMVRVVECVVVDGVEFTDTKSLSDYYTPEKVTEREAVKQKAAEAAKQKAIEDAKAAEIAKRQAAEAAFIAGAAYEAWKAEHLAGLIESFATINADFKPFASFGKNVPGTWYTTGDNWLIATVSGCTVYRCDYGNATKYYAPQAIIDAACIADWEQSSARSGKINRARGVLHTYEKYVKTNTPVVGSDVIGRLVELLGLQYFVDLARSEDWVMIYQGNLANQRDDIAIAKAYGINVVMLSPIDAKNRWNNKVKMSGNKPVYYFGVAPDGAIYGSNLSYGGEFIKLSPDQIKEVGVPA